MSDNALREGMTAYNRGQPRTANPFDPSGESWMCWRDGFDQAKAAAERASNTKAEIAEAASPSG